MPDNQKDYSQIPDGEAPIDWLRPGSAQHAYILAYLLDRLRYSVERMSAFHPRWRNNELMLQAYISLSDYDAILKKAQDEKSGPGVPIAINVPFAWATVNTIVTYLLHMFGGRSPIFQVGSYRAEQIDRAKNMEMLLQYNADYVKFIRALYFWLMDGETYGLGVMRTLWKVDQKTRKVIIPPTPEETQLMAQYGRVAQGQPQVQKYTAFEGNSISNIDPFMFFPDPRVPMHEVNEKGEYVFWRFYEGKHILLKEEGLGRLKWVGTVGAMDGRTYDNGGAAAASARGMRALGVAHPGDARISGTYRVDPNYQVDQCTIEIVPFDLGLGPSKIPEKWLFSILNECQIIQAVKLDLPSGKHPIEVAEPNSVGYAFGQLGTVDMLGPMQNMMSWFMNSHIYNVRASLNNLLVVDPTKVEMQDLASPEPGGIIRLKNTAFGLADPKSALYQLEVTDVTRSHINDFQLFGRMASDLTGATDNVRGLQDPGGRKTATEIRTSAEAGTSRLAAKGKIYSSMGLTGLAEQWSLNYQQNLSQEFELAVLGSEGGKSSVRITPDNVQGDFVFPVHDGTLPIDKIGLLDVWRQIFQGVLADPQLRQSYDIVSMFDWICQLGGAQNINNFKINMVPQQQQMAAMSGGAGGVPPGVPLSEALAGMGGSQMGAAGLTQLINGGGG